MSKSNQSIGKSFEEFAANVLTDPIVDAHYRDALERVRLIEALVEARRHAGLSQKEVARQMGVSQPTVAGFERDSTDPQLSTVQRYARAIDMHLSLSLDEGGTRDWGIAPQVYKARTTASTIETGRDVRGASEWREDATTKRRDFSLAA